MRFKLLLALTFVQCMLFINNCKCQNTATIRGVVTYFFNKYQGDKPDIGAEVWIIDSSKTIKYNQGLSDTFYFGSFYRNLYAGQSKIPDDIKAEIKNWGVEKDEDFKKLDERQMENLFVIQNVEKANKTTIDGAGNFSFQIPPGTYYVLIKSNNRKGISLSEIMGNYYPKKIKVSKAETQDVSHNFGLN